MSLASVGCHLHVLHTVIHRDLPPTTETYITRLRLADRVVTLFDAANDSGMARGLVHVLRMHGQRVPRELEELVESVESVSPQMAHNNTDISAAWAAVAAATLGSGGGDSAGRDRPLNAVPLREDSHSPAPDYHHQGEGGPGEGTRNFGDRISRVP